MNRSKKGEEELKNRSVLVSQGTFQAKSLLNDRIEDFVTTQVTRRGLDERTVKAYRLDLVHLYQWGKEHGIESVDEKAVEHYLEYLVEEKKLKYSTVTRKYRVFRYYLDYLIKKGYLQGGHSIICPAPLVQEEKRKDHELSRAEIDAFFMALNKEYERLDNAFRKRVCLRDSVIMELLFYHGIEISELLRLEVSDYNRKTAVLTIHRKREKAHTVYLFSKTLQSQMDQWLDEHGYFEHDSIYHNRMFLSKLGKPLSMKMVINIFDKYRMKAGIEKECKPKDLKNSLGRYAKERLREMG